VTSRPSLLQGIEREWTALVRRRRWISDFDRVATTYGLADHGTADAVVAKLHSDDRGEDDAILTALLRARPDPTAMRVLLQAFLPTMKSIARQRRSLATELDELEAAIIAAAWERLATYPLDKRPARIAANIALDTRKHVARYLAEPETSEEVPTTVAPAERTSEEQLISAVSDAVQQKLLASADATRLLAYEEGVVSVDAIALTSGQTWRATRASLTDNARAALDSL
jgi:hypothetical protein